MKDQICKLCRNEYEAGPAACPECKGEGLNMFSTPREFFEANWGDYLTAFHFVGMKEESVDELINYLMLNNTVFWRALGAARQLTREGEETKRLKLLIVFLSKWILSKDKLGHLPNFRRIMSNAAQAEHREETRKQDKYEQELVDHIFNVERDELSESLGQIVSSESGEYINGIVDKELKANRAAVLNAGEKECPHGVAAKRETVTGRTVIGKTSKVVKVTICERCWLNGDWPPSTPIGESGYTWKPENIVPGDKVEVHGVAAKIVKSTETFYSLVNEETGEVFCQFMTLDQLIKTLNDSHAKPIAQEWKFEIVEDIEK